MEVIIMAFQELYAWVLADSWRSVSLILWLLGALAVGLMVDDVLNEGRVSQPRRSMLLLLGMVFWPVAVSMALVLTCLSSIGEWFRWVVLEPFADWQSKKAAELREWWKWRVVNPLRQRFGD